MHTMTEAGDAAANAGATEKNPEEQESLARTLGNDLTDIFLHYIHGEISFADLTFETYETLQDLYIIASGEYELEYEDSADYEIDEATAEQEELAQEPAGPDND
ncbi:MAG TPA: hypothetical protein VFL82_12740 [Thermomicrobiales bacterium]|nr:hypothetical protein [Thermomicrobiales bacterium]